MLTAITGINWGDEGKGRMVDLLSADYDIVCRYQGGNNAGHTVINDHGKIVLNLLPSGISREGTVNVMGNGMVIDLEHLVHEIQSLREKGIHIGPDNLKISDKAVICLPWHKMQDIMEEDRLKDKKFGYTVAMVDGKITENPLGDVAMKTKFVPVDCKMVKTAKDIGISFGD